MHLNLAFASLVLASVTSAIDATWYPTSDCTGDSYIGIGTSGCDLNNGCWSPGAILSPQFYSVSFEGFTEDSAVSIWGPGQDCNVATNLIQQGTGNVCLTSSETPIGQVRWICPEDE